MRAPKIIISFFLIMAPFIILGQNMLKGSVRDYHGHPLPGAYIYMPEIQSGTSTDKNGNFILSGLPEREILVQVSFVGFATIIERTLISGVVIKDFILTETIIEAQEVVISGMNLAEERRESPIPLDIIKSDVLVNDKGTNLVEMLSLIPGVSNISSGPAISKPVIRGLSYNRILVINDGIRQEGQQWGDEHGLEIDAFAADRVEIIKGPASLMYGSDGLGGVISVSSESPLEEDKLQITGYGQYQSNNAQQGYSLVMAANKKGWSGSLRGTLVNAGEFHNRYDGNVFNSDFKEKNIDGMVGLNKKWGYTHLHFSTFNQEPGLIEGDRDSTGAFITDEKPFQTINHNRVNLNNLFFIGTSALKVVFGYQQNIRREFEEEVTPALEMDLRTITYDLKFHPKKLKDWKPVVGINGMWQENANRAEEALIPDYNLFDLGIFGFVKKDINRWFVSAGLRYDIRRSSTEVFFIDGIEDKFNDLNIHFGSISASFGISFLYSEDITLKFNVSKGFRCPNMAELMSDGVHEGTFRYEYGSSDLHPEDSYQADAGIELEKTHVSVIANTFANYVSDFIYIDKLKALSGSDSLVDEDGTLYPAYKYFQDNSYFYGGEVVVDFHPHPIHWLHFENSLDLVLAAKTTGEHLPFIPSPRFQSELKAEYADVGRNLRNLFFEIGIAYHFSQSRILEDLETSTPDYFLINAKIGCEVKDKRDKTLFKLIIIGDNLADAAYQDHLNRLKYAPVNPATGRQGIFNMGRNIILKIVIPVEIRL